MASYRFGTIEVRPAERRVLVEGAAAPLGARAFDLLVALIENRDRVMAKDELLALVWPGVVVEENNLQVQVSTLRKLLGAQAVATLPGRGYRFTLRPDEGPAASAGPRHNLPVELNTFVGRADETAEVAALLAQSRLVTVTGVGGAGKTRLTLHVAAAALAAFRDGVWLVELAPVAEERHVPLAVATALGVGEGDLAAHAARRNLLVVLDNCEHLLRGCAEVARSLLTAGPGVRILASSREPLRIAGEAAYVLPPLARAQAIELFVDRARAANPDFEVSLEASPAVAEICSRLDGLPLAIELAAARVRALSVARIAERLDDRFRLLTGGDRTAMARQQTLRASIDWSYDLLSGPERVLLRRLAVFAGGWTLEAAESVAGGGEVGRDSPVLDLLTGLVEKSLVSMEANGSRYRLLETVRSYALEQLAASGEVERLRDRHLRWFLDFASRARPQLLGPEQASWFARVDLERDNLLAALRWCDKVADGPDLGLRLLSSLKQYWLNRGLAPLAHALTLESLARFPERSRARARTLYDAGQIGYFMGRFAESRAQLEECLAIAREHGDRVLVGLTLQPLGLACAGAGDTAAALPYLEEALAIAREGDEPRRVAAAAVALAQLHRIEGNLGAAEALYAHAVEMARELDDPMSVAIGLLNLAMTAVDRGDASRALQALDGAFDIVRATASNPLGQSVLEVASGLAALREEWTVAARFFGAAEAEAGRSGMRRDSADDAFLQAWIAKARAALGAAGFDAAEAEGRALSHPAALEGAAAWLRQAEVSG
jgi:non-specific serine/threonine protein kinase